MPMMLLDTDRGRVYVNSDAVCAIEFTADPGRTIVYVREAGRYLVESDENTVMNRFYGLPEDFVPEVRT